MHIEIVDHSDKPWGHIQVDQIQFEDIPRQEPIAGKPDFGRMTLALLDAEPNDTCSPDSSGKSDDATASLFLERERTEVVIDLDRATTELQRVIEVPQAAHAPTPNPHDAAA